MFTDGVLVSAIAVAGVFFLVIGFLMAAFTPTFITPSQEHTNTVSDSIWAGACLIFVSVVTFVLLHFQWRP